MQSVEFIGAHGEGGGLLCVGWGRNTADVSAASALLSKAAVDSPSPDFKKFSTETCGWCRNEFFSKENPDEPCH